ncbi:uncharacterized protein Z518_02959 [Rhinocladiella mackenziei CBS 650.93]|uniref:Uncharacterized protein n=1 Tax=Rhinocladiella mackenziei CBS 650.93 TaxID=1442369 RepID=A0A0D2HCV7_9EURO|nr:uncharacterized protein Z518_02959 [Rhinocladiella mackenziei CBS 650.93]KIX08303.1 hypothetical protein Z518_02959 [Rhinocladiella mackenziei CBS 650.93]
METAEPPSARKEKKGLRRVWNKIREIFKHKPTTSTAPSTQATAPTTSVAPPPTEPVATSIPSVSIKPSLSSLIVSREPSTEQPPKIEVDDTIEDFAELVEPSTHLPPKESATAAIETTQDPRNESQMRFNKAQAIFAKYNLELRESEWDMRPKVPYERVSKNIRMRVKYTCHNCSTTFGHDRVCIGCQHRRCAQCSRYPPRKDRTKSSQKTPAPPPVESTTEAPRPSGEGACHECQTGFELGAQECPNCYHQICERCLQEATITVENTPGRPAEQKPIQESAQEGSTTTI